MVMAMWVSAFKGVSGPFSLPKSPLALDLRDPHSVKFFCRVSGRLANVPGFHLIISTEIGHFLLRNVLCNEYSNLTVSVVYI
jgi:hypothetical protein